MGRRIWLVGPIALAAGMLVGCGERSAMSAPGASGLRADDLVGEAAAALDATGHFTLPTPIRRTTYPEISADRAGALAVAYIGDYGHFLLPHFEMKHGGPIDLASLRACGSPLYAATPYNAASLAQASVPTRRLLGPYWLVSLCAASGGQVLSIAVSALATDEQLTSGPIRLPHPASLAYFPSAIPPSLPGLPLAPEQAAAMAARATGRRVAKVPELIMRGRPFAPQLAQWKITLESTIRARGLESGATTVTQSVYAGFVRSARSPLGVFVERKSASSTLPLVDRGMRGAERTLALRSQPDTPLVLELFATETP